MSNLGSYVKAIRKASTHLSEEPELSVCWIWASAAIRRALHGGYDGTAGRLSASCRPLEML